MSTTGHLQSARFPKLLSDLLHSNQFLKMFSFYALTLTLVTLIALFFVAYKAPQVITLNTEGKALVSGEKPKAQTLVSEAIKDYIRLRYNWSPASVDSSLKSSESFIMPTTLKAFQEALSKVTRFSKEKGVSQTVYVDKIIVDINKKVAQITGNRITSIQGMKAAGDLKLEISFESGAHTKENPWGVYIVKEREE